MVELKGKVPSRGGKNNRVILTDIDPGLEHDGLLNPLHMREREPEEDSPVNQDSKLKDPTLWDFIVRHKTAFLVGLNICLLLILLARL